MVIAAIIVMLVFWRFALAHPPDAPHAEWMVQQYNLRGVHCCDISHGNTLTDAEWRMNGGNYEVKIDGTWHKIEPSQLRDALRGGENPTGGAVVWYSKTAAGISIFCFAPGFTY